MHAANADKSARLRRTLSFIRGWGSNGVTSAELQGFTRSMAVATDVSELRRNGHRIDCVYEGTNERGRKVYRYYYKGKENN